MTAPLWSPGRIANGWVFTAGHTGASPSGAVPTGLDEQAALVRDNIDAVLEEAGCDWADVLQLRVFVSNAADIETVERVFDSVARSRGSGRRPSVRAVLAGFVSPVLKVEADAIACRLAAAISLGGDPSNASVRGSVWTHGGLGVLSCEGPGAALQEILASSGLQGENLLGLFRYESTDAATEKADDGGLGETPVLPLPATSQDAGTVRYDGFVALRGGRRLEEIAETPDTGHDGVLRVSGRVASAAGWFVANAALRGFLARATDFEQGALKLFGVLETLLMSHAHQVADVVATTVVIRDLRMYPALNAARAAFYGERLAPADLPASAAIVRPGEPTDVQVELFAIGFGGNTSEASRLDHDIA